MRRRSDRPEKGIFAGLFFLAIGVILLIGNLDLFPVQPILVQWWPMILIIGGIKHLVVFRGTSAWIGGFFWIGTGALFLSSTLGVLDISIPGLLWPILLIWFGVFMILCSSPQCGNSASDRSET